MNLRGRFFTDAEGCYAFRTVKPVSYPVPTDGPGTSSDAWAAMRGGPRTSTSS